MKDEKLKSTLYSADSRWTTLPCTQQEIVEESFLAHRPSRDAMHSNRRTGDFVFLEEASRIATKKFRQISELDKNVSLLVFAQYLCIYYVQTNFANYGTDFYPIIRTENEDWTVYSAENISMLAGLKDQYATVINDSFLERFEASL